MTAGWYRSPSGALLRWWTGWMWGPDVAHLDHNPLPPPAARRYLPHRAPAGLLEELETAALRMPPTAQIGVPRRP